MTPAYACDEWLETARIIRAAPYGHEPTIIAITAGVFPEQRAEVLAAGCDDFLHKPFRDTQLFDLLQTRASIRFVSETVEEPVPFSSSASHGGNDIDDTDTLIAALATLPPDLIQRLNRGAIIGDTSELGEIINEVHEYAPHITDSLRKIVASYDYQRLTMLLDTLAEGAEQP